MNRTDRLYALVEELRAAGSRGLGTAALAARFEVSSRTIKRDISALQQAGTPIWATSGPGGGYVLDAAATLPPLTFTPGEATAVAAALASQPGLPFGTDGRSALTKVLGAMPPEQRDAAAGLAAKVWVRPPAEVGSATTRIVDECLRAGRVVVLDYLDASGSVTRRPVEPLAYANNHGRWYLLAWCRHRRAGRWFRLDRIQAAWSTTQEFEPRELSAVFGTAPPDAHPVAVDRPGTARDV
jgi:predicted DNA-binding transcriptional regulator YafY